MARKKVEPIETLGKSVDKLVVQKSRPLFALWRSDLTLAEFKILDTYLARIDSHNPEKRQVTFGKGELEEKLGVKKINQKELEERLKHLMGNVVKIPDEDERKGFRLISLFEEAVAEQDDYGLWKVKLECTQKAMKYIFNIEHLGYCRYKLRCITSLTSRYTYIMFVYLEAHRKMKTWEVPLDELKEMLSCDKEETYKEFKRFNDLILKKIQKEMNEKTECRYTYEPVKKGRSVVAVRFTVETLPKACLEEVDENQITVDEWLAAAAEPPEERWKKIVADFNLTKEQFDELRSLLSTVPEQLLPQAEEREAALCKYLAVKVKEIERRSAQKPIRSKYGYMLKLLKQDIQQPKSPQQRATNRFNDFPQRERSQAELSDMEKKLLQKR